MAKSDVIKDFSGFKVNRVYGDKALDVSADYYFKRLLGKALQGMLNEEPTGRKEGKASECP